MGLLFVWKHSHCTMTTAIAEVIKWVELFTNYGKTKKAGDENLIKFRNFSY